MELKINKLPLAMMKVDYKTAAKLVIYSLLLISMIATISSAISLGIAYAIKIVLIIITAVVVARETEILFITHNQKIFRAEAKAQLNETYPIITGLILALIIPVGTPIYVVGVGTFIAIFIGKMVFGGFSYNPFNPAIIGRIFIALSWESLLSNTLNKGLTNYLLIEMFSLETIENTSALSYVDYAFKFDNVYGNIGDIGFIPLLVIAAFLVYKKVFNLINILLPITIFTTIIFVIIKDIEVTLLALTSNSILFCLMYLANDPITTPLSNYGRIVYASIIGVTATVMIYLGTTQTAILYAILFANMFVPLINSKTLKLKLKFDLPTAKVVGLALLLVIVTTLLINVTSQESVATVMGGIL